MCRQQLLREGVLEAGTYSVHFDATKLPSGTYVYRLESPYGMQTQTMQLVR